MEIKDIEKAARKLASETGLSETSISKIYWIPNEHQVRLVELDEESIPTPDELANAFYFNAVDDIPYPSGIVLIHPDEENSKKLPHEWEAEWSDAKVIFERDVKVKA